MNDQAKEPRFPYKVKAEYNRGFRDGLQAYAHWKDGEQQVGTTGRTLKEALAEMAETWNYSP